VPEVGPVFLPHEGEKLPDEPRRLALVLVRVGSESFWADGGAARPELDFFDLKGFVEALAADLHLPGVSYRPSAAAYLHPGRAAELRAGERVLGHFGQMHPRTAAAYALGGRVVLAGELDVEALQAAVPGRYTYTPVPRFPAALRDVAVVVAEEVPAERVAREIRTGGGELLRQVRLFDLYRGPSIPPGTKSLAYTLAYQAEDKTLIDREVDRAHRKIEDRLRHVLQAQIRGQEAQ
jgi:phenylalanyl-tRNA synthetase beta chain